MKASEETLFYTLALSLVEGIGPILARKLIQHTGSAKAVFEESMGDLVALEGFGTKRLKRLEDRRVLERAERELKKIRKEAWHIHYWTDRDFPRRLKHCDDAPLLLFQKGPADLNQRRCLAMVGSRNISEAGEIFIDRFSEELQTYGVQVISGLAYGVDGRAHRRALDYSIGTVAVVAHGLDRIYPYLHRNLAHAILDSGGAIVSEFISETNPDRENFPKRNRIIAGMSDAVLVVEAARKGGALITAQFANDYNRDVFAVPGAPGQKGREGCNLLIKSHRANLLESVADLKYILRWEPQKEVRPLPSFTKLSAKDRLLVELLGNSKIVKSLEDLKVASDWPTPELISRLVLLELEGIIKILPGNRYRLIS